MSHTKKRTYIEKNVKIYAMLSYGPREHAEAVLAFGRSIFGEKFVPVTNFVKLAEYNEFLAGRRC